MDERVAPDGKPVVGPFDRAGWRAWLIDHHASSRGRRLDEAQSTQWFAPRRSGSGWARANKARVERLTADGLMLPAGLAAVEEAKRRGTWSMLDDVEALVVPDDLATALAAHRPAGERWDAFSPSAKRGILEWIRQAKRPVTRAARVEETATKAALGQKANEWVRRQGA